MRSTGAILASVVAICIASPIASAQSSSLVGAPSMKSTKYGVLQLNYRQTSRDSALNSAYRINYQILYGLYPSLELGIEADAGSEGRLGLKYSRVVLPDQNIRLAAGVGRVGNDAELYFGAEKDFAAGELHIGYTDVGEGAGFIGFRRFLDPQNKVRFTVDHITGGAGLTGVRFDFKLDEHWSVDTRVYFKNDQHAPRTHRIGISYQIQVAQ